MGTNDEEEDEGELFDFDSGDEIPEADRQALVPPPPDPGSNTEHQEANVTGESAGWVLPPLVIELKILQAGLVIELKKKNM